mmetsp:Transcript_36543/g.90978  ORF Transcript_36543/g.90978 Transcript_36543/m.90978 type:complete len:80 (-) Transcript_36543:67-306(-)
MLTIKSKVKDQLCLQTVRKQIFAVFWHSAGSSSHGSFEAAAADAAMHYACYTHYLLKYLMMISFPAIRMERGVLPISSG